MKTFFDLLERHDLSPDATQRAAIEAELWSSYGVEGVVLVLDMSGFSRLTLKHGVVHYLSMVRRMQRAVQPIIEAHEGEVVKFEADNCFSRFPGVERGLAAAVAIQREFARMEPERDDDRDIHVSIGLDYGRFLLIDRRDFYGSPVNLASKLGEDIAEPGEILVTAAVADRLGETSTAQLSPVRYTISGIDIEAWRADWR